MSKTRMRDRVAIGQRWQRRRDRQVARIRQIHRADRLVELAPERPGERPLMITFTDLRTKWRPAGEPATSAPDTRTGGG